MSQIVDKIAAIEEQLAAVQAKAAPLVSRLTNLNQVVQTLTDQIEEVGRETLAIQTEFEETQTGLDAIRNILTDTKRESEELTEQQAETKQVCESLTTMFGEAFQVVSRFMTTAQRMGIVKEETGVGVQHSEDKEPDDSAAAVSPDTEPVTEFVETESAVETVTVSEEPVEEDIIESHRRLAPNQQTKVKEDLIESFRRLVPDQRMNAEEIPVEETAGTVAETVTKNIETEPEIPVAESKQDDLEAAVLPDVEPVAEITEPEPAVGTAASLEEPAAEPKSEEQPTEDIAAQLDVPPLMLNEPVEIPAAAEAEELTEEEEQKIENLLMDLSAPITA